MSDAVYCCKSENISCSSEIDLSDNGSSTDLGRALLLKGEGHQENNTNYNAMFRRDANLQKCGRCKVGENEMKKNKVLIFKKIGSR